MNKLTLITINYNNVSGLQKTMESVLNQTSKEFEYIIVDGTAPLNPPKGGLLKNPHPLNPPMGGLLKNPHLLNHLKRGF